MSSTHDTFTQPGAANPEIGSCIQAAGIDTNYHDMGSGAPVVLLHGSGPGVSAWANWRLNLPVLAKRYRVIAPDMVGFGYTERQLHARYDMDTWVAHLLGLLDALALDRVDVVGNSFGGALALQFATRYPDRIERIVAMGSVGVPFALTNELDAVWGYQPSVKNMRALLDIFAYDRDLVNDELAELRFKAAARPGVQEAYASMFPAPRQRWVDAMACSEESLRAIAGPVLLIHGRDDRVIPPDVSLRLNHLIDRSELHLFGRCGHWVQIEHADRFNRLVGDFLSRD